MSERKSEFGVRVLSIEDSVWVEDGNILIEKAFIGEVKEYTVKIRNHEEAPPTSRFINLTWKGAPPREVIDIEIYINDEYYDAPTPIDLPTGATVEALIQVIFNAELLKVQDPVTGEMVSQPVNINMKMLPPR